MSLVNEKELLLHVSRGDEAAFAQVYEHYKPTIYQFILKFVKSPDLAEDLTQEIFIKVWEMGARLAGIDRFPPYLYTIARNQVLAFFKRISTENSAKSEILRHYGDARGRADENMQTVEYMRMLHGILDTLPSRSREVFRLCREEHRSYEEIAAQLGISRNAVKKHMVRSMKVIRASVEKNMDVSIGFLLVIISRF